MRAGFDRYPSGLRCDSGVLKRARFLRAGQSFSNLVNRAATTTSGIRVVPFNPGASVLVQKLAAGHRSVSTANQANIQSWISAGALNN